jgi:hypothetical protein
MSRFDSIAGQLRVIRRNLPLDQDIGASKMAEVLDTFYYSDDLNRSIWFDPVTPQVPPGAPITQTRTHTVFEPPLVLGTGLGLFPNPNSSYSQRSAPVLRFNRDGLLDWRFGFLSSGFVSKDLESGELISFETTRFAGAGAGGTDYVMERIHITGPGGADLLLNDHLVIATAIFEAANTTAPNQNGATVYNVELATGFWARTTNVVIVRFDDPSDPNTKLREVNLLRGVGG